MWRVAVSSNTSSLASGGSPIHSTEWVNHGFGGFSTYCIRHKGFSHEKTQNSPRHKEVAILVRIFQRNKTTAPTFVNRRLHIRSSFDQLLMKPIHVFNTHEEVNSASPAQHRLQMLGQCDSQFAGAKLRHWRF